ncbi:uncharacterized protein SPPG_05507 [Spizellomyces punctatus DAOM BR117]|uniref:Uncharacterized protein n=1 Tax=Spizellomyces punctatus (strain DAOM BR117) TaxID=645134 RepID=A0A0L0HE11_SPIPD|nr:uncharacterized protein SPPG_05507 [Spizellomyces punctatus DAOM BR117]KNC99251.1 hypothetical protein SPPG_05507 [Spizellomyces punctatus DAOM BR117]|eukprot:XP_016607291.1 hypothetical protein SPPG_05507 [Spizellomyces punctatus DAOM BR117]
MGRNDKIASASLSFPLQNLPVNDDTWDAFLFAIHSDTQDSKEIGPSGHQALYDTIACGTRQRFSVISKASLLSWAAENVKSHDACKELKSMLDGGTSESDISDSLLARIMKVRLVMLKQEGIEMRNAAKAVKDTPEPAITPPDAVEVSKAKTPKKEDKDKEKEKEKDKDKERAKSSPKKNAKAGPAAKQPEPASRPESATVPSEVSKRKNKLRDRGTVKLDAKPTTIGDEPQDGPDMYYALKDFEPSFYSALMEETLVQMNLIIRLSGSPAESRTLPTEKLGGDDKDFPPSNWQTAEDFKIIRQMVQNVPDPSLWKSLAILDVQATEAKDYKELFDLIAKSIYSLLEKRKIYQTFYSTDSVINIPDIDRGRLRETLRSFRSLIRAVPNESLLNVDLLLAILLEQVGRAVITEPPADTSMVEFAGRAEEIAALKHYIETAATKLVFHTPRSSKITSNRPQDDDFNHAKGDIRTVPMADVHSYIARKMSRVASLGVDTEPLMDHISKLYRTRRYIENIHELVRSGQMEAPASSRTHHLENIEIQKFSNQVDLEETQRILRQLEFEELLEPNQWESDQDGPLSDWHWLEHHNSHAFMQILQGAQVLNPEVRVKVSEREAAVLLAVMGPGPAGATQAGVEFDCQAKTKVGFGLFSELYDNKSQYLNPVQPERTYVYSTGNQIIHYHEDCTFMYPNTGVHIRHRKVKQMDKEIDSCTSLYSRNFIMSWRGPQTLRGLPYFTASFEDGTVFGVSINSAGEKLVQASTADGLTIEWSASGTVFQKNLSLNSSPSFSDVANGEEMGRLITPEGTVVKYLHNNEVQVLFANGNVTTQRQSGVCTSTNAEGTKLTTAKDRPPTVESVKIICEKDLASKHVNVTREDMVIVKTDEAGQTTCEHADGTSIATKLVAGTSELETDEACKKPVEINIKCRGYASLMFNRDSGVTRLEFPNKIVVERWFKSGESEASYRILKGDLLLEIDCTGKALFKPASYQQHVHEEAGSHYINWLDGSLVMHDWAGNRFEIDKSGQSRVNLMQTDGKATSAPSPESITSLLGQRALCSSLSNISYRPGNAPRLFLLREDGSGLELLRDLDTLNYLIEYKDKPSVKIIDEPLQQSPSSLCLTILVSDDDTEDSYIAKSQQGAIVKYRQLICHPRVTQHLRKLVMSDMKALENWKVGKEQSSNGYAMYEKLNPDAENVAEELTTRQSTIEDDKLVYGRDRNTTEQAIRQKYLLKESDLIQKRAAGQEIYDHSKQLQASTPTTSKPVALYPDENSRVPSRKRRSLQRLLRDGDVIPGYFSSPEGQISPDKLDPIPRKVDTAPAADSYASDIVCSKPAPVDIGKTNEVPSSEENPSQESSLAMQDVPTVSSEKEHTPHSVIQPNPNDLPTNPRNVDVLGRPRRSKVPLPAVLRSSKPGMVPNAHYIAVEAHARRQINTASTARLTKNEELPSLGTFDVLPSQIKFGTVKAGESSEATLTIINVGNDSARFKIKHQPGSCITSSYKQGPVAPGMRKEVQLVLRAPEADKQTLKEVIQVITESWILNVPCSATISSASSI